MDTYQCPVCGGTVTRDDGCQRCGRPYDPDIAALAMFKRTVASLEAKKRKYEKDQLLLRTQLAHASAQRDSLARIVREKFEGESRGSRGGRSRRGRRGGDTEPPAPVNPGEPSTPGDAPTATHTPTTATMTPAGTGASATGTPWPPGAPPPPVDTPPAYTPPADPVPSRPPAGPLPPSPPPADPLPPSTPPAGPSPAGPPPAGPQPPGRPGRRAGSLPPAIAARLAAGGGQPPPGPPWAPRARRGRRPGPPPAGSGQPAGAETTTATSQSVLLAVGGLLLAGAAVVLAVFGFGSLGAIGRVGLLTLATMILLILPMALTRRGLNATAETVASVGLLMVLLDGYVTWSLNLFAAESIPTTVYFGLVCLATAVIATAYRGASHLIAPRYATILVLQPVIPLLGYVWLDEPAAWALALTGVATMDLALGISLTRPGRFAALAGFVRPVRLPVHLPSVHLPSVHLPGRHPHPTPPDPPQPPDELLLRPESRPEEPDDVKTATGYPIAAEPIEIISPRAEHPTAHPSPVLHPALQAPAILRDLTWVLFTLAFGAALSYATVGLATTNTLTPTVRAAMVLILTVTVGMAGALSWRRYPLPDLAGGLATLAVMASITRVGSTALPGHALLFAALAVAVAAVVVPMMPAPARLGPRLANAGAAVVTAVLLLWRAVPAINGPVRAARPWWHADLPGYADRIGATAGPAGWQLVAAGALLTLAVAIALPGWIRIDATLTGGVLTMLTVPAVLHLNWATTPAVLAIVAIAIGATGLLARTERTAASFVLAAGALGGYAALTSLTRPAATALTLSAITLGGFVIASLRPPRTDPGVELAGRLVGDWASGGAAFALPGAVCSGLAALVAEQVVPGAGAPFVLAGGFVAVSGTLGYATIRLISARHPNQPLLVGTSLGAVAVAVAAVVARGSTIVDMTVGLLLLSSAVLLWLAPSMSSRVIFGQRLTGPDVAAAAVTASTTAAMARVLSLLVPGIGLVTTAVLVLAVAVAVRALPAEQRRGPVVGGLVVGAVVATAAGAAALGGAAGVVRASSPWWHAALGPAWTHTVVQYAPYGWQGPITLLLVAAAAAIVVPEPLGDHLAAIAIGLAAIGAAAGFGLAWWSPMVIGMLAAIGLGMAAAATDQPRVAYTRIAVAGAVGAFAAVASLVRPASTASTLESLAIAAVLIAAFAGVRLAAARTAASRVLVAHLVPVGGGSSAAAVLALAGAAAALAAGERHPASVVMAGALAATSLGLAVAGLACWRTPAFLPYVTAGVALSSSVIALAALPVGLPVGVYGATGALLGVLAELMRVNAARRIGWRPEDGWQPVGNWNPRRTAEPGNGWIPGRGWLSAGRWRPAPENSFRTGAAAAGALPAVIALAALSLPLMAALFGPYHFAAHPWTSTPTGSGSLEPFGGWAAHLTDVITAAVLTFAGALAAVGLGGSRQLVADRIVAVAVPGAGLTLLLVPAALHVGSVQATFALLVTTLCGLSLALTLPPTRDSVDGDALRVARRLVFALAVLAALAGQLGSLATRSQTIEALAGSVVVGAVAATWGRYALARMIGWNVAVGSAGLLAVAASLAAGFPARWAAFPLLGVAALAVALAAALPLLRRVYSLDDEITVIEGTALLAMVSALVLTLGAPRYTALALTALGAVLGLAVSRPGRPERQRQVLIFAAAASEVVGVWLLMSTGNVALPEAYSLPFAVFALLVGLLELRRRPDIGSWLAYGPALVAGFLPTLVLVLMTETAPLRRILLIVAGVLTVALGSVRRQKAPVVVGSVVTAVATLNEMLRLSAMLPWWVLLLLFGAAGALLVTLGANYEKRRHNVARLRATLNRLR